MLDCHIPFQNVRVEFRWNDTNVEKLVSTWFQNYESHKLYIEFVKKTGDGAGVVFKVDTKIPINVNINDLNFKVDIEDSALCWP